MAVPRADEAMQKQVRMLQVRCPTVRARNIIIGCWFRNSDNPLAAAHPVTPHHHIPAPQEQMDNLMAMQPGSDASDGEHQRWQVIWFLGLLGV